MIILAKRFIPSFFSFFTFFALCWFFPSLALGEVPANTATAIALHGEPKYPADFKHFAYVDPSAPKDGVLKLHSIGTFDSLNPFVIKGNVAQGVELLYDTLMVPALDEVFSYYGLVAEAIEVSADHSWVIFHLNPKARFSDGEPISAEDVAFTFDLLLAQGSPHYRSYYADVASVKVLDKHRVKFSFHPERHHNAELPLILAQLPVLPKHFWQVHDFTQVNLQIPLGSGPYLVARIDPGKAMSYERNPDYWAKDLPVNLGRYNFSSIQFDYYRDDTVAMEAFKAGQYDFRQENTAKTWATEYDFPAVKQGKLRLEEVVHKQATGMQAFVFNTRRAKFQNPKVRLAIGQLFNFTWSNENLFYDAYKRSQSYFSNSELAATGLPGEDELALLEPFRDALPEEVFTQVYQAPGVEDGDLRKSIKAALDLFGQAGWRLVEGKLVNAEGKPFVFEILLVQRAFERIALPFVRNLQRLGMVVNVRLVDAAQYINRLRSFDFDMVVGSFGQSLSPGNEQRNFWHSAFADKPGSRNLIGVNHPVVDALVDEVILAKDRSELITAVKALDRVLLWQHYVIPQWYIDYYRLAYWRVIRRPEVLPDYGIDLYAWWYDEKDVR